MTMKETEAYAEGFKVGWNKGIDSAIKEISNTEVRFMDSKEHNGMSDTMINLLEAKDRLEDLKSKETKEEIYSCEDCMVLHSPQNCPKNSLKDEKGKVNGK